ncbi:LPS export ABC transporter periplasmic protein LptC [Altererythrobacter lauratis]|uniref:LPS export ABC transporter periplasmic protein LptC n=1 Tax=Alteraurantiacibacter lauratis TaxID=2054627 RepID=A0ABV7EEB9_9SPHN
MTIQADRMRGRRQAFAAPGSRLDRIVRFLAVALPAGVGVVAAMMLITPLGPRGEVSFLLDRNKVAIADDRLRMDNALYRGVDRQGRPFSIEAGDAVQTSNTVPLVEMHRLVARIVLPEGPAVLSAAAGTYNIETERVTIPGTVQFTASDGYAITASNVSVFLSERRLLGEGGVEGVLPAGTFSADRIEADLPERNVALIGNARLRMVPGQMRLPSGFSVGVSRSNGGTRQ